MSALPTTVRLIVSGEFSDMEMIAEPFTVPGSDQEFAVHITTGRAVSDRGQWTATHVATGFAIAHADTIDGAIAEGIAAWQSKTPEQIQAACARALAAIQARDMTFSLIDGAA